MVEFAVMGSLGLFALAFLIQIMLRMFYQVEIEGATFRRALWLAQQEGEEESQATSVIHFRDRQLPDPSQTFAMTTRVGSQASATVTWGEWLTYLADDRDSQARTIVRQNTASRTFRSEDVKGENSLGALCDPMDTDDEDCEPMPLIGHIHKTVDTVGQVSQDNVQSDLSTQASETTTLTFNTDGSDTLTSSTSTNLNLNW